MTAIPTELPPHHERAVRLIARASTSMPVHVITGNHPPTLAGSPGKSTYHRGSWRTISRSDRRVEVGRSWLYRHRKFLGSIRKSWTVNRIATEWMAEHDKNNEMLTDYLMQNTERLGEVMAEIM